MSLTIWQLDPANLTPYYNLAVCDALADAGQQVRYITSRYLYDTQLPVSDKYTVDYAYFKGLNRQWLRRYPVVRKALRGLMYPLNHRAVLAGIKRHHPDVVHIQWSRLPLLDRRLIASIQAQGIPVVHTIHNVRSSFASERMVAELGPLYALVDRLVLHTESNRRDFLALYPDIAEAKTRIIPLINAPYQHPIPDAPRADVRREMRLEADAFVLLFFGIIRQYKGLTVLLDAFQRVARADASVRLLIVGKAEGVQDVADVAGARSIPGVSVYEGFIPADALWRYFSVSDLALFPYHYITQSAALIQAMDFGKPVITTDAGAFPETVDGNGWIVPTNDPDALAAAILNAMQDRGDLLRKGARSRELIELRHGGSAIARAHIAVYEELVSGQQRRELHTV